MNRILLFAFTAIFFSVAVAQQDTRPECGYRQNLNALLAEHPTLQAEMTAIEKSLEEFVLSGNDKSAALVTIPVVVHVIYRLPQQNISDEQIQSQITVLNEDFGRLNADQLKTPGPFLGVAANCDIMFCLAELDPNGNPTNGITRTSTTVEEIGQLGGDAYYNTSKGGQDIWDRNKYLNIWVCETGDQILGFASPPSLGTLKEKDGVVIGYKYFGTNGTVVAPNNKGRTTTHEVGHWLGLEHTWGKGDAGGTNCGIDDGITDTPNQEKANYYCPTFPTFSCADSPDGDMFMNYMDYVDDACMNIFTHGQKTRMQSILNSLPRMSLLSSNAGCSFTYIEESAVKDLKMEIFPNPSKGGFSIRTSVLTKPANIIIYDILGAVVFETTMPASGQIYALNPELGQGLYTVVLTSGGIRAHKKLVIEQ